jgi:hypothetical protein
MTTEWQYQLDVNNANSVPFRKFPQRSRDFTRCFPVRSPAVPLQPNYNDCGMYASMNFYLWIRRVMLTKDLRKGTGAQANSKLPGILQCIAVVTQGAVAFKARDSNVSPGEQYMAL